MTFHDDCHAVEVSLLKKRSCDRFARQKNETDNCIPITTAIFSVELVALVPYLLTICSLFVPHFTKLSNHKESCQTTNKLGHSLSSLYKIPHLVLTSSLSHSFTLHWWKLWTEYLYLMLFYCSKREPPKRTKSDSLAVGMAERKTAYAYTWTLFR